MAIASVTEQNSLAAKYGQDAAYLSLHTADPGGTGANEVSGGSPAYARKPITWSAPSNGLITGSVTFDVPPGATITHVGVWSAATGGNFLDKGAVTQQAFASQGQYTVTASFNQT